MDTMWLMRAKREIEQARLREAEGKYGMQFIGYWGQTKHWSEWHKIWLKEKAALMKKHKLKGDSNAK